ncbi:MAG: formate--tetrahydrofolate ligase [Candidatus Aminicenantes bacterium]|nr:formate--tetrahydrofolate ligase [Candidatus Aminicenantes bacterium]NIM78375.1 formate--tetrahydrofolate ligase [Candidatus Aminicenantes bacterium]NIN17628.1 formate--tetrahydrofolate ligase [Candidatus Aminicenantes bacterium]NIN41504.1 formate--tetrahydrofolate ligase [Candidatus Aminicenantes bacterium]NIN84278.1 formate--tetrahydrofolate ligase [Candidatus Aminicenantes bacterium]
MLNDNEIAKKVDIRPIEEIAEKLGIEDESLEKYGKYKAKISPDAVSKGLRKKGKLIMVTAMSPTPAGEGKTTTSIGLADALNRLGKKAAAALREPSLGPVFGMKGGATGGGLAQVMPRDEINLHFTGDIHAVTAAHNLLAAMVDNRLHFDGACGELDCRRISWKRVMDMDDRVLREVVVGIGGPLRGIARETEFDITAASEVMAILCLSENLTDLKERLGNILIGYSPEKNPVFAREIKAEGSMAALLKEAVKPNLVQTLEGTPVFIHGGPFANIAHGTSSVIATRMALHLADFVVTETGFASDLGAEKFFNIVVRTGHIPPPDACVLVATLKALKYHGGVKLKKVNEENIGAIEKGFENLQKHIENLRAFGIPFVIALNIFPDDTGAEIEKVKELCDSENVRVAPSYVFLKGSEGGIELAHEVLKAIDEDESNFQFLYPLELPLLDKIEVVAKRIYGASSVAMEGKIRRKILRIEKEGFGNLPVCIAKTQYSLSGDDEALGRPRDFTLIVTDVSLSSGAGFVVVFCGDIMTMPGLPKHPAAEKIDITDQGEIVGLS